MVRPQYDHLGVADQVMTCTDTVHSPCRVTQLRRFKLEERDNHRRSDGRRNLDRSPILSTRL